MEDAVLANTDALSSSVPETTVSDIAVVILTFNEARHIERAIESVRSFARDVLVVDSFSTDDTVRLATTAGARVLANAFINQAKQFQWAVDTGQITAGWILRLDADEIIEPDLAQEICVSMQSLPDDVVGVNFNRKHIFMGRWVRHGGRYPLQLLRLFRRGYGRVEDRWMDEHIVVWGGRTITFKGGFVDMNMNDLTYFTDKHNKYASREAVEVLNQRYGLLASDQSLLTRIGSRQAILKRLVKERVYNRLPFWMGPLGYFIYRYFIQLGFLDRRSGLIYHFLQGFWYRFLVGAKIEEFEAALANCATNDERRERLTQLSGLKIVS